MAQISSNVWSEDYQGHLVKSIIDKFMKLQIT